MAESGEMSLTEYQRLVSTDSDDIVLFIVDEVCEPGRRRSGGSVNDCGAGSDVEY